MKNIISTLYWEPISKDLQFRGQQQIAGSRSTPRWSESPSKVKHKQSFGWHRLVLLNAYFRDATSTFACDYRRTDVEGANKFGQQQIAAAGIASSHLYQTEGGEG